MRLTVLGKFYIFNPQITITKISCHHSSIAYLVYRPWFVAAMTILTLTACKDDKQANAAPNSQPNDSIQPATQTNDLGAKPPTKEKKSSLAMLGQMHNDTVLRQVRLPRYDENFRPLSLLHADRMEVIKGNTVEARDVSLELYDESGDIKARTKVKRATYKENDAILMAEEAIYISGKGFQTSGTGMVYDINTGQGFIIGPASSLFNLKSSRKSDTQP